jgi:tetratricopeptide (TPR) repeat protein
VQDEPGNPIAAARPEEGGTQAAPADKPLKSRKGLWQLPTLLVAGGLLTAGIAALIIGAPQPDLDVVIDRAESLIAKQEFRQALDELNVNVRPWYDGGTLTADQMRRFHILRARAVYMGQKDAGVDLPENARTVADEYAAAARETPIAEPRDLYFLADAHVTLGLYERALELAKSLPRGERGGADPTDGGFSRIYRRVIERQIRDPAASPDLALRLLNEFLSQGAERPEELAWALSRQSQILIRQKSYDAAIARLLRTIPALLPDLEPHQAGDLYLLLARAYLETGAITEAGRQLSAAVELLLDTDPRWAAAMVLLARVEEITGQPPEDARAEARQKYLAVISRFEGSEERIPALLGLAEVEAAIGDYPASIAAFTRLVDAMLEGDGHIEITRDQVIASLLARWRGLFDVGQVEPSLQFASLAERLSRAAGRDAKTSSGSAEILIALARAHRTLADEPFAGIASSLDARDARLRRLAQIDAASRQSIRAHLSAAGRYYKMHADAVSDSDNTAFGESLWAAAEAFDLAGDLDLAIPLLADYVRFFPGDPRRAEARFRLGRAYQSRGDFAVAAENFRGLITDARALSRSSRPGEGGDVTGVGPYADLSYVPLAQVLLLDPDPANDAEAEALLGEVVAGRVGSAGTPQFRDGLVELGLLLHRRGDHAGAIQRFDEVVARFPTDSRIDTYRYHLAEANRQDAAAIRRTLAEAMPDHRRQMLEQARVQRLRQAEALYEHVRRALEARDAARLTKLESIQLRNSYFYLGDCAFELSEYEVAIQRYDAARERFPTDPAALVAMVQIVNAYVEQGDHQRALTANERARRFYQSIPASAWSDPDLPMSQQDWQRWLDSMTALRPIRSDSAGSAATATVEERGR